MDVIAGRRRTVRDRVRRRVLTTALGFIDNRAAIRRAVTVDADQATANQGNGPYYVPGSPRRSDIREGRAGAPLSLRIRAVEVGTQAPVEGATVEIWHCDAAGIYSGYQRYGADRFPALVSLALRRFRPSDTATFLRGQQITDSAGYAGFQTIVPGWYTPRTLHIHVRVSVAGTALLGTELYFSDEFAAHVQSQPPYDRRGRSPFGNTNDIEIRMAKGSPGSWPNVRPAGDGHRADVTLQIRR
jgi:protocatechuate 3,4-dioxygenase beta subunit